MPFSSFNPRARVGRDSRTMGSFPIHVYVSIHAPVWGATCGLLFLFPNVFVSIHAPVWGATGRVLMRWRILKGFNPRARVGRDVSGDGSLQTTSRFQSTRPCGARPMRKAITGNPTSFNPRARVGRDP